MPITLYRTLLDQSLNLANVYGQSSYSLLTKKDKDYELKEDYKNLLEFERLKKFEETGD